jgi:hypothetical protein
MPRRWVGCGARWRSSRRVGKGALFAPCPPSFAHGLKWWAHQRCAHSRDPLALPTLRHLQAALRSAAVLSVQVREYQYQRKRERPDEGAYTSTFMTRVLTVRKAKLVSIPPSGLFVSHLSVSCLTVGTVEGYSLVQIPPLVPLWMNTGPPLASVS